MKLKIEERRRAVELRERGYSVNEIVAKVGVAKSSVSMWVRNVPVLGRARTRLLTRIKLGQLISAENKRKRTAAAITQYTEMASQELSSKNFDEGLKRFLCSLIYWCEGTKNHYRGVNFTNSDPQLIASFMNLFRDGFTVNEDKFRARVHLHGYHDARKQIAFWSKITKIPIRQFRKPYRKPNTGKRIRKDYPGCLAIRYGSNDMARQLLATAQAFLKAYGGIG